MANTAFTHDPTITVPSSSTANGVVLWNGTTGKNFDNANHQYLLFDGNSLDVKNNGTASSVKLYCESSNAHAITLKSPAHSTFTGGSWTLTLPGIDGIDGQFLKTNGSGVTSWAVAAELATIGETNTGTNETKSITPNVLAGSNFGERVIQMVVVDFGTNLAVAASGKFWFHVPSTLDGFNIVEVHAEVITAPVGQGIIIDLYNLTHTGGDLDILTTNLTINAGDTGSDTATAAQINTSNDHLATNDVIRVDIDQVGTSTTGAGLIVTIVCRLP